MHPYIISIKELMIANADEKQALAFKAYLLNQFEHFGLKTALRRKLCREYFKQKSIATGQLETVCLELWNLPQREFHYAAVELLAFYKDSWTEKSIRLFEYMITHRSWWDTVDHIASELTGPYFKKFGDLMVPVSRNWNRSDNIWLQRSSIMFQKSYRAATNKELLTEYILHCRDSEEFFVRKAIGWALREYSKTNPSWVEKFVLANRLHPLSSREALKRIKKVNIQSI